MISKLNGGTYQPWFQSIYTPPSGEIESLLFALQAAIGSIIIGYFLGYYRALAKIGYIADFSLRAPSTLKNDRFMSHEPDYFGLMRDKQIGQAQVSL